LNDSQVGADIDTVHSGQCIHKAQVSGDAYAYAYAGGRAGGW
jgi:hypothetical protein